MTSQEKFDDRKQDFWALDGVGEHFVFVFQVEMEQLRATLHSDLQEKNEILDKLTSERGEIRY